MECRMLVLAIIRERTLDNKQRLAAAIVEGDKKKDRRDGQAGLILAGEEGQKKLRTEPLTAEQHKTPKQPQHVCLNPTIYLWLTEIPQM
jgi:hypothetical protein